MSKHKLQNTKKLAKTAKRRNKQWRLASVGIVFSAIAIATYGGWTILSATRSANAESIVTDKSDTFIKVDPEEQAEDGKTKGAQDQKTGAKDKNSATATKPDPKAAATAGSAKTASGAATPAVPKPAPTPAPAGLHQNIITTYFWAGEGADASNAHISNVPSAWDEIWSTHYGGVDDPNSRNGWYPAAFTPKENPFYFALPYNDVAGSDASGKIIRRPDASKCSALTGVTNPNNSWCKNAWIKVIKGAKVAYAQWQDVGPMLEDDSAYVFGTAQPRNTALSKAGLDVSPAMRDYLGLQDVDRTSWMFVPASAVPAGPWKNIVTTSGVYWQ